MTDSSETAHIYRTKISTNMTLIALQTLYQNHHHALILSNILQLLSLNLKILENIGGNPPIRIMQPIIFFLSKYNNVIWE